jgi:hypothetical protein
MTTLRDCARSRAIPELELLALRHQLHVFERLHGRRLWLTRVDRLIWVWFSRVWSQWRAALAIVNPQSSSVGIGAGSASSERGRVGTGRPTVDRDVRMLIRTMAAANPLWGVPRIHGELLKLGFTIAQTTVAKYMGRHRPRPSSRHALAHFATAGGAHVRPFSDSRMTVPVASQFKRAMRWAYRRQDASGFTVPMELLVGTTGKYVD